MKKLLQNLWFQLAVVTAVFFATAAHDGIGAILWFGFFICWVLAKRNES